MQPHFPGNSFSPTIPRVPTRSRKRCAFLKLIRPNKSLKTLMNVVSAVLPQDAGAPSLRHEPREEVLLHMICCITMLFLHFGAAAPVLPQSGAGSAVQAASLPEVPS